MVPVSIHSRNSKDIRGLLRPLEVTVDNFIPNTPGVVHKCFDCIAPNTFLIPAQYALKQKWCGSERVVKRSPGERVPGVNRYSFSASMDPRRGQVRARERVVSMLEKNGAALLSLPCGGGKTVVALSLMSHSWPNYEGSVRQRPKALILCHKTWLLDQWEERIGQFLSVKKKNDLGYWRDRSVSVGRYQGSRMDCNWESFDIICASLSTVFRRIDNEETSVRSLYQPPRNRPFLVIIDETHHVSAPTFLRAFKMIRAQPGTYVLGLSATPRRKDGLDIFLRYCFGDKFITNPSQSRKESSGPFSFAVLKEDVPPVPKAIVELVHHPYGAPMSINTRTTKPDFNRFLQNIVESDVQSSMIAHFIRREARDPLTTGVLVLSDRVKHLKRLNSILADQDVCVLYGGQTRKQKEKGLRFESRITLSTFSFLSEGVDVRKLNVLVFMTPKRDIEQAAGRVARDRESQWVMTYTEVQRSVMGYVPISNEYTQSRLIRGITRYAVNSKALIIDFDQCGYAKKDRIRLYGKKGMKIKSTYFNDL